jgi:hypothetical protein
MLLFRIAPAGALLVLSALLLGCAADAVTIDETTATNEALTSETFTLYTEVDPDLSSLCDTRTVLTLSSGRGGEARDPLTGRAVLYAHLQDEAAGTCRIHVDPTPRDYALLFEGNECGSLTYSAGWTLDGRAWSLSVTDNRERICKNFVPARLVVVERKNDGSVRTLYSYDGPRGDSSAR